MAHMHYKGTGKVHSFRGLLADGGQDKIRIQGPVGAVAWRIVEFQIFPELPGTTDIESTVQIFREEQTSVSTTVATVHFTNSELLGVAFLGMSLTVGYDMQNGVVFDNTLFVRNIYVTHTDTIASSSKPVNYYIELEEVKVSAAGMAQLAVAAARRT